MVKNVYLFTHTKTAQDFELRRRIAIHKFTVV